MVNRIAYDRYVILFCHFPTDKTKYNIVGDKGKAKICKSIEEAERVIKEIIVKNKLLRRNCDWVIFREISESEYSNL